MLRAEIRFKRVLPPHCIEKNHHLYLLKIFSPCSGNSPSHRIPEEADSIEEGKKKKKRRGKVLLCTAYVYLWLQEIVSEDVRRYRGNQT